MKFLKRKSDSLTRGSKFFMFTHSAFVIVSKPSTKYIFGDT